MFFKFHVHKWIPIRLVDEYQDWCGFPIEIWEYECEKCGKRKQKRRL